MWLHGPSGPELIHTDHVLFSGVLYSIISMATRVFCEKERKEVIIFRIRMDQAFPTEVGSVGVVPREGKNMQTHFWSG